MRIILLFAVATAGCEAVIGDLHDRSSSQLVSDPDSSADVNAPDALLDSGGIESSSKDIGSDVYDGGYIPPPPCDAQCCQDGDCGGPLSGVICVDFTCISGCRSGTVGRCPYGQTCMASGIGVIGPCVDNPD